MQLEDRMLLAYYATAVGLTPAQVATAYGINAISLAVDHRSVIGNGAGQTIAIVEYYDDPHIMCDLAAFDQHFGLPAPPSFTVLNEYGKTEPLPETKSKSNEFALDVEWAHAIAPKASIIMVEAETSGFQTDEIQAIRTAASLPGVTVVSMSFGVSEFDGEQAFDSDFTTPPGHTPVTFLASTGDSITGTNNGTYPAFSPNVLAVGGTTLSLKPDNSYKGEVAYNMGPGSTSSGGISQYELEPAYQQGFNPTGRRTIPDVSILAGSDVTNPGTAIPAGSSNPAFAGVAIYNSYATGAATPWTYEGGTSLATPIWAGLIATADQLRQSVGEAPLNTSQALHSQALQMLYSLPPDAFHDIVYGHNLVPYYAGPGYDLVTGRGSPVANVLVPALAGAPVLASVQREGIHHQTAIDLSFFGALDPGSALDLYNYRLLAEGPHGFYHRIRLRSARYNAATQTVVLVPKRLPLNYTYELVVRGKRPYGLKGANGIFLAGGNQTVIFSGFTPYSPVA